MPERKYKIFISSVQKELQKERRAVKAFISGDPLCRRFFNVFLFEDVPATDRRSSELYLEAVKKCDIYVGLFGNKYGATTAKKPSPVESEFTHATELKKTRLVFIKGDNDKSRDTRILKLIRKVGRELVRRRFSNLNDLTAQLYSSLVQYLEDNGKLHNLPFDADVCRDATLKDISVERIRWFLEKAKAERNFALNKNATPLAVLTHLNLVRDGKPTNGGIFLFGKSPQKFRSLTTSEIKCLHFHGTEVRKPIPSYQIYKGCAFEQVDQAVDFVMSKIDRSVTPSKLSPASDVAYEIPKFAVREAIVNAIAHRDYTSNASVQVMLFADRLEIWNPGELPTGLTFASLRREHPSIPHNPLICDPLFLAHYIEKAGTGTLDMISLCRDAGLPAPEFEQRGNQFVLTIWRSRITDKTLSKLNLNDRQKKAVNYVKKNKEMTRKGYVALTEVSVRQANLDLADLVKKKIFDMAGKGRATKYILHK